MSVKFFCECGKNRRAEKLSLARLSGGVIAILGVGLLLAMLTAGEQKPSDPTDDATRPRISKPRPEFDEKAIHNLIVAIHNLHQAHVYRTLLQSLATPLFPSFEQAFYGYTDRAVMIRTEAARQRLVSMGIQPNDVEGIRAGALAKLESCHWSMETIRKHNAELPDVPGLAEGLVKTGIAIADKKDPKTGKMTVENQLTVGEFGLKVLWEMGKYAYNKQQTSSHWQEYRSNYAAAREIGLRLADVAASRSNARRPPPLYGIGIRWSATEKDGTTRIHQVLPNSPAWKAGLRSGDRIIGPAPTAGKQESQVHMTVRQRATGKAKEFRIARTMPLDNRSLGLRLTGSWEGTFPFDALAMRNVSGQELTNCVVVVTLKNDPHWGPTQKHIHFVEHWPANEERCAIYWGVNTAGIVLNESLDRVQRVTVELYSDQFRDTVHYQYWNSRDYTADVRRWCNDLLSFTGKFSPATTGFFGSDASVTIRLKDYENKKVRVSKFTPSKITITLREGLNSESQRWEGLEWKKSGLGIRFKDAKFNRFNIPTFEVRLSFAGTDYEYVVFPWIED